MRIVACVRQVRVLADEVEFTDDGRDVDPGYVDFALNEWDAHAVEEALRIRERSGDGEVVVITVGGEATEEALRRCLAMGADRAIRVEPGSAGFLDPITVARAMADRVRAEQPDLVLAGVQSSDSVQAATGTALAELLGLPRVAVVTRIDYTPGEPAATVHRELEGGLVDVTEVDMPALLTVQTGINEPRYANLRAIKMAESKPLEVVGPTDLGLPEDAVQRLAGSHVLQLSRPVQAGHAEMLEGDTQALAARIATIIKEAGFAA
jgi:electron transfer flavoprotein beta subunit